MRLVRQEFVGPGAAKAINAVDNHRGNDGFEFFGQRSPHVVMATGDLGTHSVRIGRLISSGHRYRFESAYVDWFGLARPHSGRIEAMTPSGRLAATAGQWLFLAPGRRDLLSEGDEAGPFTSTRLLVSWPAIARCLAAMDIASVGKVRDFVAYATPEITALEQAVFALLDHHDTHTRHRGTASQIEALVTELTAEVLLAAGAIEADAVEPMTSLRKVREAEELLRSTATEHISMLAIARHLNIGIRSLELTFKEVRGFSARDYLKVVRLDMARQRLLTIEDGEDVTRIALESGLSHLGRFSLEYARRFGERPSETIRAARLGIV